MGKIIENYSLQQELGSGVYSRVYKAINLKNQQEVAIKMVKADKFRELPKLEEGTVNEINILSNLEYCPHIIRYYDMLKTVNNFYFVYEFCNGGTMESLLKKQKILDEKTALNYFSQIVEAFKVLNKNSIMHRDLKPDNILIHDGILKLADFGFCKPLENENETTDTMLGSPLYMAPEILKGETYTIKADIWSLGVVLYRMLFGECPYQSANIGKLIMMIDTDEMKIPTSPEVSPRVIELLKKMLTKDAKKRCDWNEIFSHKIVNGEISNSGFIEKGGLQRQLTDSGMKGSLSPTLDSSTTPRKEISGNNPYSSRDFGRNLNRGTDKSESQHEAFDHSVRGLQHKVSSGYNPSSAMRSTYSAKTPLRENMKKDMMLKSHGKCIDFSSIMLGLCSYECYESLLLAFMFADNIEKELSGIIESIRKESDMRSMDEHFMKTFYNIVENQLEQLRRSIAIFEEEIRIANGAEQRIDQLKSNRKAILKKFITSLKLENLNELMLASRVLDFIEDSLYIRKETYERMSKDQLQKKIRDKVQSL